MSAYLQSAKIFNNPSAINIVSTVNSTSTALGAIGNAFVGTAELCTVYAAVCVTVNSDTDTLITVEQSADQAQWILANTFQATGSSIPPYGTTSQTFPIKMAYVRVTALNNSGSTNLHCNLVTKLLTTSTIDSSQVLNVSGNVNVLNSAVVYNFTQSSLTPGQTIDSAVYDISSYGGCDILLHATGATAASDTWQLFVFPTVAAEYAFALGTATAMTADTAVFSVPYPSVGAIAVQYITGGASTTTALDVWVCGKSS